MGVPPEQGEAERGGTRTSSSYSPRARSSYRHDHEVDDFADFAERVVTGTTRASSSASPFVRSPPRRGGGDPSPRGSSDPYATRFREEIRQILGEESADHFVRLPPKRKLPKRSPSPKQRFQLKGQLVDELGGTGPTITIDGLAWAAPTTSPAVDHPPFSLVTRDRAEYHLNDPTDLHTFFAHVNARDHHVAAYPQCVVVSLPRDTHKHVGRLTKRDEFFGFAQKLEGSCVPRPHDDPRFSFTADPPDSPREKPSPRNRSRSPPSAPAGQSSQRGGGNDEIGWRNSLRGGASASPGRTTGVSPARTAAVDSEPLTSPATDLGSPAYRGSPSLAKRSLRIEGELSSAQREQYLQQGVSLNIVEDERTTAEQETIPVLASQRMDAVRIAYRSKEAPFFDDSELPHFRAAGAMSSSGSIAVAAAVSRDGGVSPARVHDFTDQQPYQQNPRSPRALSPLGSRVPPPDFSGLHVDQFSDELNTTMSAFLQKLIFDFLQHAHSSLLDRNLKISVFTLWKTILHSVCVEKLCEEKTAAHDVRRDQLDCVLQDQVRHHRLQFLFQAWAHALKDARIEQHLSHNNFLAKKQLYSLASVGVALVGQSAKTLRSDCFKEWRHLAKDAKFERRTKEELERSAAHQTHMLEASNQAAKFGMLKLALAGIDGHPSLAKKVLFNAWHVLTIREKHATELAKSKAALHTAHDKATRKMIKQTMVDCFVLGQTFHRWRHTVLHGVLGKRHEEEKEAARRDVTKDCADYFGAQLSRLGGKHSALHQHVEAYWCASERLGCIQFSFGHWKHEARIARKEHMQQQLDKVWNYAVKNVQVLAKQSAETLTGEVFSAWCETLKDGKKAEQARCMATEMENRLTTQAIQKIRAAFVWADSDLLHLTVGAWKEFVRTEQFARTEASMRDRLLDIGLGKMRMAFAQELRTDRGLLEATFRSWLEEVEFKKQEDGAAALNAQIETLKQDHAVDKLRIMFVLSDADLLRTVLSLWRDGAAEQRAETQAETMREQLAEAKKSSAILTLQRHFLVDDLSYLDWAFHCWRTGAAEEKRINGEKQIQKSVVALKTMIRIQGQSATETAKRYQMKLTFLGWHNLVWDNFAQTSSLLGRVLSGWRFSVLREYKTRFEATVRKLSSTAGVFESLFTKKSEKGLLETAFAGWGDVVLGERHRKHISAMEERLAASAAELRNAHENGIMKQFVQAMSNNLSQLFSGWRHVVRHERHERLLEESQQAHLEAQIESKFYAVTK